MSAPTVPSIETLAGSSESEVLAELLLQSRRNVTAAGGTPGTSPTYEQARAMTAVPVLAEILREQRNLENAL